MEALKLDKDNERRDETRHACSQEIFFATQNQFYEGRLKNYSRNGLFIRTKEDLQVGHVITVVDPHPDGDNKKRQGQILWKSKEGIGIELFRSRNDRESKILRFEQKLKNRIN